jgi:hypothetical protein
MKQKLFSNFLLLTCAACIMAPLSSNAAAPGGGAAVAMGAPAAAARPIALKQVEDLYENVLNALSQRRNPLKTVKKAMNSLLQQTRDAALQAIEAEVQSQQPPLIQEQKDLLQALKNIHGLVCQYNEQNNPVDLNLVDPGINKTLLSNQTIDDKVKEFKQYSAALPTGDAQAKEKLTGIIEDMLLLTLTIEINLSNTRWGGNRLNLVGQINANAKIFLQLSTMLSANAGNPSHGMSIAPPLRNAPITSFSGLIISPPTPPSAVAAPPPSPSPLAAVASPPTPSSSSSTSNRKRTGRGRRTNRWKRTEQGRRTNQGTRTAQGRRTNRGRRTGQGRRTNRWKRTERGRRNYRKLREKMKERKNRRQARKSSKN